jgi:hypothetical protein
MSELPERIWAWQYTDYDSGEPQGSGEWYLEDVGLDGDETEYRRADLPPSDADILAHPKVRGLVEAAQQVRSIDEDEFEVIVGYCAYYNLRAALAAMQEGVE